MDTPPRGPTGITTPQYGNGTLWVQPLPLSPREMAERLSGKSVAQSADSQVTALIQQWLDRMAEERAGKGPALPSWTTTIAGKKVGLDSKWVYLGPIKVPSALLALLPIMQTGNPTQAEYARRLNQMRDDLFEAARRSANYDDFKQAVKDLRQQKLDAQEFKKNQRSRPDSGHGG